MEELLKLPSEQAFVNAIQVIYGVTSDSPRYAVILEEWRREHRQQR